MLRIAICDDSQDDRLRLLGALQKCMEQLKAEGSFLEFSSGQGLLSYMEKHAGELDLVFLDMEMGAIDGMTTAQRIRSSSAQVQLVFVTAYADRVFEGYSVAALAYIMKPPKPEQLLQVLERCLLTLDKEQDKVFLCKSGDISYRIALKQILYFKSEGRRLICRTAQRDYSFYGKLDDVQQRLGSGFVRVHQRYLVRCAAVERFSPSQVILGGDALPVSRSCQQSAMLALAHDSLEDIP